MTDVFIYDALRTPTGRHGGGLSGTRPDDLAATVLTAVAERTPALDPAAVDDVILGNANGAGEENRNVGRMAVLLAGFPTSVPGSTVNRLCGSGLEAVVQGSRAIQTDDASIVIAGGTESMTRAPWVVEKPSKPFPHGNQTLYSTTLGWRFPNPRMLEQWRGSLGDSAEILAEKYSISRERQDEFAYRSHRNAAAAWDRGDFDAETIPVPDADITRDESIRPNTSLEVLATLRPAFKKGPRQSSWATARPRPGSAGRPWRESPVAASPASTPTSSGSVPSRRPIARSPARASAGATSTSSN
jgi:acetyl-CoA acetyltransferase family protein